MIGGYHGKLLRVDLTRGRVTDEQIPEAWMRESLGGRGFGARILLRDVPADADPLGPENALIISGGPVTGFNVGGSGRHAVHARSPLTNLFGESFVGGFFGTEMRRTGWDGIIVTGRAEHPTYLEVVDGRADLKPAHDLWGRTVSQTEEALLARHPKARVASIGPAGENLVRFASILNDRNRAAGRTGMGAVMGSKKLKAIVVRGQKEPPVADKARFDAARKAYVKTIAPEHDGFGKLGTSGGVAWLSHHGILPTRNWRQGAYERADKLDGQLMFDTILTKRDTCTSCPVMCKRVVETEHLSEQVEAKHGGPEYETLAAWGSMQDVASLDHVALANKWCNEYGMDTISAGAVVAHAMEAAELGAVPGPAWGDSAAAIALLHQIARREGLGAELAEGVARFSEKHGTQAFALHVKGCELPMHEPRGKKGLGLSYACTPRGANHMDGMHDTSFERENSAPDIGLTQRLSRFDVAHKAFVNKACEDGRSFTNSLVMCSFDVWEVGADTNLDPVAAMVAAVTGLPVDRAQAFQIGERNFQLARLAACKFGLKPEMDDLPARLKREPLPFASRKHATRHEAVTQADLDTMKSEYYALRGWDPATGAPTTPALRALGIG